MRPNLRERGEEFEAGGYKKLAGFERSYAPLEPKNLFQKMGIAVVGIFGLLLSPFPFLNFIKEKIRLLRYFCYAIVIVGEKRSRTT